MNFLRLGSISVLSLLVAGAPALRAGEQLELTSRLFVFKNSEFRTVATVPVSAKPDLPNATSVQPPGSLRFDDTVLSLEGAEYRWSSGAAAPAAFAAVPVQSIRMAFDQPATIRCAAPTQYLEKQADGTLRVREIAADSPDVPRYLLTFLAKATENALQVRVACRAEIATVLSREPIPGVELEVGRPRLNVRRDEVELTTAVGAWNALLLRAPKENDYSVLALFKLAPVGATAPASASESPSHATKALPSGAPSAPRTLLVSGSGAVTETGAAAPQPTAEHPVRYLAYPAGFFESTPVAGGEEHDIPSAVRMSAALRTAMAAQGFAPAAPGKPPSIVVIYHWGSMRLDHRANGGFPMAMDPKSIAFVIISAYDYADLTRHQRTLLWRVGLHTTDRPADTPLAPTLLALMRDTAPLLGRDLVTRRDSRITLASADDFATAEASPAPAENAFGELDGDVVRALAAREREKLEWKRDLPMSSDMEPHQPITISHP
ncbi:MAG TPA: hypothetical protein VHD32_13085 [Candidatus Didemnitutus sp.]|nr:hypothetical protein [Candidatus Didemnitutus sp.]